MSQPPDQSENPASESQRHSPIDYVLGLRAWATANRFRSLIIGATLLLLVVCTICTWLFLASLAVEADLITVDLALQALDENDHERAVSLAERLNNGNQLTTEEAGGPLFVLGAIKAAQADSQWSAERRRADFLVAARYLGESRALGFPPGRDDAAMFLLGRSLLAANEWEPGIAVLEEALKQHNSHTAEIFRLLSDANLHSPAPHFEEALRYTDELLSMPLSSGEHADATLTKVQALVALKKFTEAQQALDSIPSEGAIRSRRELLNGWLLLEHSREMLASGANLDSAKDETARNLLVRAEAKFVESQSLDRLATIVTRLSMYLHAEVAFVQADLDQAIGRFAATRKLYPETPEGIAAALREADLLLQQKEFDSAFNGYRRVLAALRDPKAYRNPWLPLIEVQRRFIEAHAGFVSEGQFRLALTIADEFVPLFDQERQISLRAETLEEWARSLRLQAANADNSSEKLREAREHFRQAGATFKQLAESRYATRRYGDDLWRSAENFYQGQCYSFAVDTVQEYLNNEPQRRNALALLRLGQCYFALDRLPEAIAAFEECIEFQPYDAAIYQARIDCARAYRAQQNVERAEKLLMENISGGALTPQSPEWRISQFELGSLLHEAGRYLESVKRLEEAVERYPDDPQARLARYEIAESYRHAAVESFKKLDAAKAVSEREQLQARISDYLGNSLRYYGDVQREIAAHGENSEEERAMRRNCYMLQGSVLFDLGRFKEAVEAYSNVATLYQNEPFVLETLVQIAHCWNRLHDDVRAKGQIEQAKLFLQRLPENADFVGTTNLTRQEWIALLDEMSRWWRQDPS